MVIENAGQRKLRRLRLRWIVIVLAITLFVLLAAFVAVHPACGCVNPAMLTPTPRP